MHQAKRLYDADAVRRLDALAIESGIDGFELMQRAGQFTFDVIRSQALGGRRIAVFCGHGNNGGDGYVIARLAHEHGLRVCVVATEAPKTVDAAKAAKLCPVQSITVEQFGAGQFDHVADADFGTEQCDFVVDAVLGNGLTSTPRGAAMAMIETINRLARDDGTVVVAVDVPSGLNSSNGHVAGLCVQADHTVTFIGMKPGLLTGRGPAVSGQIRFHDCGIDQSVYEQQVAGADLLEPTRKEALEIARSADAHKGSAGRVLIIGSNLGYFGAARLSCEAALRTGAGLVSLATRVEHYPQIVVGREEIICRAIDADGSVGRWLGEADVVAIGPGLGQDSWARCQFEAALGHVGPLVIDADALNLLAEKSKRLDQAVITPHPGEAGRLLNISSAEVQADRIACALRLQEKYACVVVLKGAGTVIVSRDRQISICDRGHAGMASAGMGDVLTGIVASLLAQGAAPETAARLGVWIHATAAEDAGVGGAIGIVAGDLMQPLRRRRASIIDKN